MMRILPLFALCLLAPLAAHAQDQQGAFKNVFSENSLNERQEKQAPQAPRASTTTLSQAQPSNGWRGRPQATTQQQGTARNTYGQGTGMPQQPVPSLPMHAATPQPLIIPTEDPEDMKRTVFRPDAPKAELDLPPQVNGMIKDYAVALRKLTPDQVSYVENIVQEGYKLDEPLHEALIKSMDWNICMRSSFVPSSSKKHFQKFKETEEKLYLENASAFEKGVLSQVNFMDTKIIQGKIAAQGVISMSAMKQLYLLEASKASPQKVERDCEILMEYLREYSRKNAF